MIMIKIIMRESKKKRMGKKLIQIYEQYMKKIPIKKRQKTEKNQPRKYWKEKAGKISK